MKKQKDLSIETLRGLAILLMVAGHVIGNNTDRGMQVADDSGYRYFYYSLMYLRMPLFTVISGYVYSLRPLGNSNPLGFLRGKARRLLLPLVFVGTGHYLSQVYIPGTNETPDLHNIWRIYFFSYSHFWFLHALFLVFITVAIAERYRLMDNFRFWLISLGLASVIFFVAPHEIKFFSFPNFAFLLPFFILGIGINRFSERFKDKKLLFFLTLVFFSAIGLQQLSWYEIIDIHIHKFSLLSLVIGLTGTSLLFAFRRKVGFLAHLGSHAYSIYLFHVFGTASSRIVLSMLNIRENYLLIFTVSLAFGLFLPVIMDMALKRFKLTRLLFLGLRYNGKPVRMPGKVVVGRLT